jgi:hypothetical protein
MATTVPRRADALLALGGLREQTSRLNELAEELHAQTTAFELFVDSVFSQADEVDFRGIEGGDELVRMFDNVLKQKTDHIDRERTLELYEAVAELVNAVEETVMRESEREEA